MPVDERSPSNRGAGRKADEPQIPPPDGSTYLTSRRAKTGVGNEPDPIDVRETGDDAV